MPLAGRRGGGAGYQTRSRFVDEIDSELIEHVGQLGNLPDRKLGGRREEVNNGESWKSRHLQFRTNKGMIRIDSLSDSILDDFLSGEIGVEELLNR